MAQIDQVEDRRSAGWLWPAALFVLIGGAGLALGAWLIPGPNLSSRLAEPAISGAIIVAMTAVYVVTRLGALQDHRENLETAARLHSLETAIGDALTRPPVSESRPNDAAR